MRTFTVDHNDAGQRLDKFVTKVTTHLPKSLLYKYIRKKRIKVNGKKCNIATMLVLGDQLDLYLNDEFFAQSPHKLAFINAPTQLDIVYEDQNILLVNKPVGMMAHGDHATECDTLVNRVKNYLYTKNEYLPESENSFAPALCNRIDRNTQGIVIAAKNAPALRILNEKIKQHELKKFYLCMVQGVPVPSRSILRGYLIKDELRNKVTITNSPITHAKEVITEYSVISSKNNRSLVEILLHTGRSHQIRAHMASIGHPLIGDTKYGGKDSEEKYQLLTAYKIGFAFDTDAGILEYLNGKQFTLTSGWFETLL